MSDFIGRQIEIGLAVEGTRNTAETTAQAWLKKVKADIQLRAEKVNNNSTQGRLESYEGTRKTKQWYDGTLEGIVNANSIGFFLYNIYGTCDDGGTSGAYTHDFTLDQTIEHPTLSIFAFDSDVDMKVLNGGMVSKMEISASVDDYVRYKIDMSALEEDTSSETPSYSAEADFIGKDITVKLADSEAGLPSATALKVKNATISYNTGLIRDHVFGAVAPDNSFNSMLDIDISLTLNYADETLKDMFENDTEKVMQVAMTNGSADLTFTFYKVVVTDWSRSGDSDKLVTQEVKLKAYYDGTYGVTAQSAVSLTNTYEAYTPTP